MQSFKSNPRTCHTHLLSSHTDHRLPEVQSRKRPLGTPGPDDPDPPAFTCSAPHQFVGLFFFFIWFLFLKQTLLDFKSMHTKGVPALFTPVVFLVCVLKSGWEGFGFSPWKPINREAAVCALRVASVRRDARRILGSSSPRRLSGSWTHCGIKEQKSWSSINPRTPKHRYSF